jgi:bifunctional non-homologous end joining protein LigD
LREDKPQRSIVLEKPGVAEKMEMDMAREPMKASSRNATPKTRAISVAGIAISHPDKELWPAAETTPAITKLDLARYYEAVAPRMLPHIAGRPLSLVRAPDGIGGERFFQRHVLSGVSAVQPVNINGEKDPFHSLDSTEGLVALAQAAVLEIHPWGSRPGDPETPERLIFDLDPAPDLPFERVIKAAHEIGELLKACGFAPYVKTTGGKGIHVAVAIKGTPKKPAAWPEAKAFARAVADRMAKAAPTRYTTNMAKTQRSGKIFLDYLRNDRMATAVAPWSPRAREGATIAAPLPWSAVKKGLDPKAFTIASIRALLKRADPWKDLAASAGSLDTAMTALNKAS